MDINKFTEKAREAIGEAQTIAAGMGHQETGRRTSGAGPGAAGKGIVPVFWNIWASSPRLWRKPETSLRKPSVSGGGMDPKIMITPRLAKILGGKPRTWPADEGQNTSAWTIFLPR